MVQGLFGNSPTKCPTGQRWCIDSVGTGVREMMNDQEALGDIKIDFSGCSRFDLVNSWNAFLKTGPSSTVNASGVYCVGEHRRGCCAHYMVHVASDVGPEMNLYFNIFDVKVDRQRRAQYPPSLLSIRSGCKMKAPPK